MEIDSKCNRTKTFRRNLTVIIFKKLDLKISYFELYQRLSEQHKKKINGLRTLIIFFLIIILLINPNIIFSIFIVLFYIIHQIKLL